MKKLLKALGVAALIGSIPYAATQNKETGEFKLHALLWNLKVRTNEEGEKHIDIKVGFSNPFAHECRCGGNCHCHDGEEGECCCHADEAAEEAVEEVVEEEETPIENPEEN